MVSFRCFPTLLFSRSRTVFTWKWLVFGCVPGPSPAGVSGVRPPHLKYMLPISFFAPRLLHTSNIVLKTMVALVVFGPLLRNPGDGPVRSHTSFFSTTPLVWRFTFFSVTWAISIKFGGLSARLKGCDQNLKIFGTLECGGFFCGFLQIESSQSKKSFFTNQRQI